MGIMADIASFEMQRQQGKIARGESEVQAKQEEAAGISREVDRKQRLSEALASQNANAAAGGVAAFEGSPLSVMEEDMRREGRATASDEFQTRLRASTLRAGGKIAQKQARAGATIGLLTDIESRATKAMSAGG